MLPVGIAFVGAAMAIGGCAHGPPPPSGATGEPSAAEPSVIAATPAAGMPGISGMARLDSDRYLVVHDTKVGRDGPRLGWLTVDDERGVLYRPLEVAVWSEGEPPANDLEGVCSLGEGWGTTELLVNESGPWSGGRGRLFHLSVSLAEEPEVEVVRVMELPELDTGGQADGDENYEGLACTRTSDSRALVILGERGASSAYPSGILRWGIYDSWTGALSFGVDGARGVAVTAPLESERARSITGLHLTEAGDLWASAAEDRGDMGPFRSILYRIGRVDTELEAPVVLRADLAADCRIDGYKIEALAASDRAGSTIVIGSEDETLGGTWRPVSCPGVAP